MPWVVKASGKSQEEDNKDHPEENLKITIEENTKIDDFLDVVLDLSTGTQKSFIKPNANTKYVSMISSHPPNILKSIPEGIFNRLSTISTGKEEFNQEVGYYHDALDEAGYNTKLNYIKKTQSDVVKEGTDKKKKRHRNIL